MGVFTIARFKRERRGEKENKGYGYTKLTLLRERMNANRLG